jgi:phosphoribosylaminoimidazole-succinocarboxamide synthase
VPEMTPDIIQSISNRYIELFEQITGETFVKPGAEDVTLRVENAINNAIAEL